MIAISTAIFAAGLALLWSQVRTLWTPSHVPQERGAGFWFEFAFKCAICLLPCAMAVLFAWAAATKPGWP